ncbi:MAG TPA: helix-turn-helix domain-containing protein [Salinarimonas sp.]|nr:helix-turn-helix domain-containing protein [Salinarimonas sp.]
MAKEKAPPFVRHDDVVKELLRKPGARKAYEERKEVHRVALAIRKMREDAGLTQKELAAKIGTSQPVIARLERSGARRPNIRTLEKIAKAVNRGMTVRFESAGDASPVEVMLFSAGGREGK